MTPFRKVTFLSAALLLLTSANPTAGLGQNKQNDQYFIADRLLQQQKYKRALELFSKLHSNNPSSFIFYKKTTECLINLKRYEEAIELSQEVINRNYYTREAQIRMGEIHHIKGDTTKALDIWKKVRSKNNQNLQVMLSLARTMQERKDYEIAIQTYRQAAEHFPNSSTISIELAQTYLQSGRYEKAIQQYLQLLQSNPDRINFVQSTLLRFNDDYLYDIAILEIDEFLEELSPSHPSHKYLHNLHLWLLMERNLYKRALATAKNYEESSGDVTYSLYGLGAKLLSEEKFRLAKQAYSYYVENNIQAAKYSSMEELARVNVEWADFLSDYNLANASKRDSLYREAFEIYETLQNAAPSYQNLDKVLIHQAGIALDHLHKPEEAKNNLNLLEELSDSSSFAQQKYIEGRIKLHEKDYARARIAFTRSNKGEQIGDLAQKTRYYLALTDFYSGDYEYAKIQLNALERQNTSYFANDAVKLRMWLQEGLQSDSTGKQIDPFANAVETFSRGNIQKGIKQLSPILDSSVFHPLKDEALLELSSHLAPGTVSLTYTLLGNYLERSGSVSPLRERLMWEKARMADQVVINGKVDGLAPQLTDLPSEGPHTILDIELKALPSEVEEVITLYEEILLEYPNGFYSSYARNRIQKLEEVQT